MNKIILRGRLTKDTTLKYTEKGLAVTRGTIAVGNGFGEKKQTDFFNFLSFGKTGEAIAQFTSKGSNVLLIGKLKNNNYEKDGVKNYTHEIYVEEVEFLEKRKEPLEGKTIDIPDSDLPF